MNDKVYLILAILNTKDGLFDSTGVFIYKNKKEAMNSAKHMAKSYAKELTCDTKITKNGYGYKISCEENKEGIINVNYMVEKHPIANC